MSAVLRSHNSQFAIELARSQREATLITFQPSGFAIHNEPVGRVYDVVWKPQPAYDAKTVAQRWLKHPLGLKPYGQEEAIRILECIATDQDWTNRKVAKVEKQIKRAGTSSARAREILKTLDWADPQHSKKFYLAVEGEGIDRKTAASVLCIERKKVRG